MPVGGVSAATRRRYARRNGFRTPIGSPALTWEDYPVFPEGCTVLVDGTYCDGPCKVCDGLAEYKASEAEYNRREDAELRAWLGGKQ